jgi:predicted methyltransferase
MKQVFIPPMTARSRTRRPVWIVLAVLCCIVGHSQAQTKPNAQDLARDVTSKPSKVLDFLGVQPGWVVLDLFGGDGYYSQALAQRVGPNGMVYLHNNVATKAAPGKLRQRLGMVSRTTGRSQTWPNIAMIESEINTINLPSDSLDLVILVKVYHDAYYRANGWQLDPDALFQLVHRVLKPKGILAVIDHEAVVGSGSDLAQTLHRIEPAFAIEDISARDFVLLERSTLLHNPTDDLTRSVFHPSIRSHSSRFLLKFSKHRP